MIKNKNYFYLGLLAVLMLSFLFYSCEKETLVQGKEIQDVISKYGLVPTDKKANIDKRFETAKDLELYLEKMRYSSGAFVSQIQSGSGRSINSRLKSNNTETVYRVSAKLDFQNYDGDSDMNITVIYNTSNGKCYNAKQYMAQYGSTSDVFEIIYTEYIYPLVASIKIESRTSQTNIVSYKNNNFSFTTLTDWVVNVNGNGVSGSYKNIK